MGPDLVGETDTGSEGQQTVATALEDASGTERRTTDGEHHHGLLADARRPEDQRRHEVQQHRITTLVERRQPDARRAVEQHEPPVADEGVDEEATEPARAHHGVDQTGEVVDEPGAGSGGEQAAES